MSAIIEKESDRVEKLERAEETLQHKDQSRKIKIIAILAFAAVFFVLCFLGGYYGHRYLSQKKIKTGLNAELFGATQSSSSHIKEHPITEHTEIQDDAEIESESRSVSEEDTEMVEKTSTDYRPAFTISDRVSDVTIASNTAMSVLEFTDRYLYDYARRVLAELKDCPFAANLVDSRRLKIYIDRIYRGERLTKHCPQKHLQVFAASMVFALLEMYEKHIIKVTLHPDEICFDEHRRPVLVDFAHARLIPRGRVLICEKDWKKYDNPLTALIPQGQDVGNELDWWNLAHVLLVLHRRSYDPDFVFAPQSFTRPHIIAEVDRIFAKDPHKSFPNFIKRLFNLTRANFHNEMAKIKDDPYFAGLDWHKLAGDPKYPVEYARN